VVARFEIYCYVGTGFLVLHILEMVEPLPLQGLHMGDEILI
jgi:hypothetical protein